MATLGSGLGLSLNGRLTRSCGRRSWVNVCLAVCCLWLIAPYALREPRSCAAEPLRAVAAADGAATQDPTTGAGFTQALFDGHGLGQFVITGCEVEATGDSLLLKAGDGFVRSRHMYADFVLELDWRALRTEKWDSGIYFRAPLPAGGSPWPARYQVNLQQGQEGNAIGLAGATSSGLVKAGDWNHFKLTVIGRTAALEINGSPAWQVDGVDPSAGYIGLQAEVPGGGQYAFRNIRVTELAHESLFNGNDLTGWEGGDGDASTCWKVENGQIICTGGPGPWLKSKETFGDFNLRLEYKIGPRGNSGIYVRVPANGAHRGQEYNDGQPTGTEVQILDDRHPDYAKALPYQNCGSVYAIAAALPTGITPPDTWNQMEINCRGSMYDVYLNGIHVVHADGRVFPELAQRLAEGHLGLQNHDEFVAFRYLRIAPAME